MAASTPFNIQWAIQFLTAGNFTLSGVRNEDEINVSECIGDEASVEEWRVATEQLTTDVSSSMRRGSSAVWLHRGRGSGSEIESTAVGFTPGFEA